MTIGEQRKNRRTRRRVIEIPGVQHNAPIPAAVVIDRLLVSSAVFGASPKTGSVPEDLREEVAVLFANFRELLAQAGASSDDVARVGVLLRDNEARPMINEEWNRMFPDPDDRPARHITIVPTLPARAQVEIIAVLPDDESAGGAS